MNIRQGNGQCPVCGDDNSYNDYNCNSCGSRLPWTPAPSSIPSRSAQAITATSKHNFLGFSSTTMCVGCGQVYGSQVPINCTRQGCGADLSTPNATKAGDSSLLTRLGLAALVIVPCLVIFLTVGNYLENLADRKTTKTFVNKVGSTVGVARDLLKPSSRLVGCWQDNSGQLFYFGTTNNNVGTFSVTTQGVQKYFQGYKLLLEKVSEGSVNIAVIADAGVEVEQKCFISEDGNYMKTYTNDGSEAGARNDLRYFSRNTSP